MVVRFVTACHVCLGRTLWHICSLPVKLSISFAATKLLNLPWSKYIYYLHHFTYVYLPLFTIIYPFCQYSTSHFPSISGIRPGCWDVLGQSLDMGPRAQLMHSCDRQWSMTWQLWRCSQWLGIIGVQSHDTLNGYGSIPIHTIFRGMNIHKFQLFWCELQGDRVLTHPQISTKYGPWLPWLPWPSWHIMTYHDHHDLWLLGSGSSIRTV